MPEALRKPVTGENREIVPQVDADDRSGMLSHGVDRCATSKPGLYQGGMRPAGRALVGGHWGLTACRHRLTCRLMQGCKGAWRTVDDLIVDAHGLTGVK